jgi:cold shock CspA family protein
MHTGICEGWDFQRGFGFIVADAPIDGREDRRIFAHKSSLPKGVDCLTPGMRVEFTTQPSRRPGMPDAARITRIIETAKAA